jgi:sugar phosphate isomerase/epimerase
MDPGTAASGEVMTMETTRRQFVASAVGLAAAQTMRGAEPALRFPAAPRERLAIASYSLRSLIDSPRRRAAGATGLMDIKDVPAFVVKQFEIRRVEILGQHLRSTEAAYLDEYRSRLRSAGVQVVNIPTSIGASLYDPDAARRGTAVENAKKSIDVAGMLDCPSVRLHIQKAGDGAPDVDRTVESLAGVAQYAASKGVVVNLENDDLFSEDAFFLAKVIDQVKSPWVRALPDFCNSMLKGDPQFNYDAVTAMFRRAYNICHLKDSEVEGGKVIRIDLARTFEIAKSSGYKGYFSVEFEGEGDPVVGTGKLVEAALRYLT